GRAVRAFDRRRFLGGLVAASATASARAVSDLGRAEPDRTSAKHATNREIDFRFRPRLSQATVCFPDDPYKSLIGQNGELRYGFVKGNLLVGMEDFSTVCSFSLAGMQDDRVVRQWPDAPHVPIVHTLIDRPTARLELTAFATRHGGEGRVDNVLVAVHSKHGSVAVVPRIHIRSCGTMQQFT